MQDQTPVLAGPRVLLRPGRVADRAERLAMGRDPEFHRLVGGDPARARLPLTPADVERWYTSLSSEPLHWAIEAEGRLVGTARLHGVDPVHRRARYAVGLFLPEHRGRGYGAEATRLVLEHGFGSLRLHRIDLRVLAFNHRAIATYQRCGFVQEGIEREGVLLGDRWYDEVVMGILEHEHTAAWQVTERVSGGPHRRRRGGLDRCWTRSTSFSRSHARPLVPRF